MSDRPIAFYDDLGLVPDPEFAIALLQILDEQMSAEAQSGTAMTLTEEVHEMTVSTLPPELDVQRKPPRRRWIIAVAAAAVVAVGAGLYIAGSDDGAVVTPVDSDPTTEEIAPVPSVATTEAIPSTTISDDPESSPDSEIAPAGPAFTDQQIASMILLPIGEYQPDLAYGFVVDSSVAMEATIASTLPECAGYEMAFESPDRPARVATRMFERPDDFRPQYVVVLPDEQSARSVFGILADPEFWATCGVAYTRIEPGTRLGDRDVRQFPRSVSDASEMIDPPQLDGSGDESTILALTNELGPVYFSVLRVGRAVVTLEFAGPRDSEGTTMLTPVQIEAVLDSIVSRAENAFANDASSTVVDDEFRARSVLLDNADFDFRDFEAELAQPVRMDGDVAARLASCEQFVDTVFESERRPASIAYTAFYSTSIPAVMTNYVVVHPSEEQAAAMLDGMQDPAFRDGCVPAYYTTLPLQAPDSEYWFPFFLGDQLPPPEIDVDADDVLVARFTGTWTDDEGVVHGPEEFAYAAVRVGRIVASIDVELKDSNGAQVTSIEQFEDVVQILALRAAAAQQPVS